MDTQEQELKLNKEEYGSFRHLMQQDDETINATVAGMSQLDKHKLSIFMEEETRSQRKMDEVRERAQSIVPKEVAVSMNRHQRRIAAKNYRAWKREQNATA